MGKCGLGAFALPLPVLLCFFSRWVAPLPGQLCRLELSSFHPTSWQGKFSLVLCHFPSSWSSDLDCVWLGFQLVSLPPRLLSSAPLCVPPWCHFFNVCIFLGARRLQPYSLFKHWDVPICRRLLCSLSHPGMSLSPAVSSHALTKKWAPPQARCAVLPELVLPCGLPVLACSSFLCEAPLTSPRLRCSLWIPTHASCVCSSNVTLIPLCPLLFVSFLADVCSLKVQSALCIPRPQLTWIWGWHRKEKNCLLLPSPAVLLCPLLSPFSTLFTFSLFLYPRMLLKVGSLWWQDYSQGKDSRVNV